MKTIFKYFAIAILLLIAVLVFNTLQFKSKQMPDGTPTTAITISDSVVSHLSQAIQYRTMSFQDVSLMDSTQFEGFLGFLQKTYPLVHSRLSLEKISSYSLLFKWNGSNSSLKPILLMGHYDVVPVIQGTQKMWKKQPFAGEIADGFVYGRGTLDDKSTVLGILEAVELLLKQNYQPARSIYLAFGHDEEISGRNGAQKIAALLQARNLSFEYLVDEGGTVKTDGLSGLTAPIALIGIAEKGYTSIKLTATGEGGHSSMPPAQTSIGMLAEGIDKLQKNQFPSELTVVANGMFDYLGPEMPFAQKLVMANRWLFAPVVKNMVSKTNAGAAMLRTTIAPTVFNAGVKDNVLPVEASATVNFRILPGESVKSVVAHVKKAIDNDNIKVENLTQFDSDPSPVADTASLGFRVLHRSIKKNFPKAVVAPYLLVGATDARYYRHVCQNAFRFMPIRLTDEDLKRPHGTNERIGVEDFKNAIRFYVTLIQESN
jgi:carboxypeptidase PM20D1